MDYVKKFASEEALRQSEQDAVSSSSESSMSDFSEDEAQVSCSVFGSKLTSQLSVPKVGMARTFKLVRQGSWFP